MADAALVNSVNANGTATPATATITPAQGNLLVAVIVALGTSPTISTPAGWTQILKNTGGTLIHGVYILPNAPGGANSPSATLGGTVTGWIMTIFEFSNSAGANTGIQGSAKTLATGTAIANLFPTSGQTLYNELFIWSVVSAGATFTPSNKSVSPLTSWSSSVQSQTNVQGLSADFFWMSGLGAGVNQYPSANGSLSSSVVYAAVAAWLNTNASQPGVGEQIGGVSGSYVPNQFQGMIGG